jgi:hypothetical protein
VGHRRDIDLDIDIVGRIGQVRLEAEVGEVADRQANHAPARHTREALDRGARTRGLHGWQGEHCLVLAREVADERPEPRHFADWKRLRIAHGDQARIFELAVAGKGKSDREGRHARHAVRHPRHAAVLVGHRLPGVGRQIADRQPAMAELAAAALSYAICIAPAMVHGIVHAPRGLHLRRRTGVRRQTAANSVQVACHPCARGQALPAPLHRVPRAAAL